jgi:hypothetical protein
MNTFRFVWTFSARVAVDSPVSARSAGTSSQIRKSQKLSVLGSHSKHRVDDEDRVSGRFDRLRTVIDSG